MRGIKIKAVREGIHAEVDEGLELESLPGDLAFRREDAGRFFDELLGGVAGQDPYAARGIGLLSTQERKEKNVETDPLV